MFGRVERAEHLTPHLVRVVLGGEGLADFVPSPCTDSYVNAYFLPTGAGYAVPFDTSTIRALPRAQRPASRRYTVRTGTPGGASSGSTSSCTATPGSPVRGPPVPGPATCCSSAGRPSRTPRTRPPTGT